MKYSVYKYDKEKNSYKFMNCMTLRQMRRKGIDEEKRIQVGTENLQKYVIK
jgi:hypothetical protein